MVEPTQVQGQDSQHQGQAKFRKWKAQALAGTDLSRKGSIDNPIADLIYFINERPEYFTTSSCSGRVCLYEHNEEQTSGVKKKGCTWLYTTHDRCDLSHLLSAVKKSEGAATFKFEPFVLHVQCCSLRDAQTMHAEAVAAGFRNSGLTCGKHGKIIAAVRSTHSLEVPLSHQGHCLVSEEYIAHLVALANTKMVENLTRIERFFQGLRLALNKTADVPAMHKHCKRSAKKLPANNFDNQSHAVNSASSSQCSGDKGDCPTQADSSVCLNDCVDWFLDNT